MDPVRSLSGIVGGVRVQERAAGGKGNSEAFRRALQQEGEAAEGGAGAAPDHGEVAVRTGLQARPPAGRRDQGPTARHVDVLA